MACTQNSPTVALSIASGVLRADAIVDPAVGLAPNALVANAAGLYVAGADGWLPLPATLAFSSGPTNNTYVATVSADLRSFISPGTKIRLTQSATVKYFVVSAITATTITLYGDAFVLANAAITLPSFSADACPVGWPRYESVGTSIAALNAIYGGTPPNGARALLIAAGPVENVYLPVVYSSALGKWVSAEMGGGGDGTTNPGVAGSGVTANGAGATGLSSTVSTSWAPANAGMTFQVKGYGQIQGTGNAFTTFADIYLAWSYSGGVTTSSVNIGSGLQNTTTNVRSSWASAGNPGGYEFISIGIQARNDGNAGNGTVFYGRTLGRWVG